MQQHNIQTKKKMKQENFFFIELQNEAIKGKCRQAQNQKNKIKFWLKAQIAKNQAKMLKGNQESTDSNTCLKTIKQFFFFCLFYQNIN
jgi:hypothetical protein